MQQHGKSFLLGLVGTFKGRLGWAQEELVALVPAINSTIANAHWLSSVDFDTIHYVMRFGASAEQTISCRHSRKHDELEVASQVAMQDLHDVFLDRVTLRVFLCTELLRVFDYVQAKYSLAPLPQLTELLTSRIVAQKTAQGGRA